MRLLLLSSLLRSLSGNRYLRLKGASNVHMIHDIVHDTYLAGEKPRAIAWYCQTTHANDESSEAVRI
jgi:hypothetical protein